MSFRIYLMNSASVKIFTLATMSLSIFAYDSIEKKELSRWQKIKEVLLSKSAKIAYCVTATILCTYSIRKIKKFSKEQEQARSSFLHQNNSKIISPSFGGFGGGCSLTLRQF